MTQCIFCDFDEGRWDWLAEHLINFHPEFIQPAKCMDGTPIWWHVKCICGAFIDKALLASHLKQVGGLQEHAFNILFHIKEST